jgi:hypothetical protein
MSAGQSHGLASIEAEEDIMSADSIHVIIAVGIIALMFAWVPFANVVCPPGFRSAEKTAKREPQQQRPSPQLIASPPLTKPAPVSSLSSRRLAEQSRDLLDELSARGEQSIPQSQPAAPYVPRENALSQKEIIKTCAE